MFYKITSLVTLDDYVLLVGFSNSVYKKFDLKKIMNKYEVFKDLMNIEGLYNQARIDIGGYGIIWNEYLDISCNGIYEQGEEVDVNFDINLIKERLIHEIVELRKIKNISQKQLEVLSGVSQPIIARIEKNQVDPQLTTLIKLLSALGVSLTIENKK